MKREPKRNIHIAILAAMQEEVGEFVKKFKLNSIRQFGDLKIYQGLWTNSKNDDVKISLAWSGWGKVSSARAVTRLISLDMKDEEKIDFVLFSGVAGAVDINLKQWDIVIASSIMQHDLDARPLFERYVIPSLNKSILKPRKNLIQEIDSYLCQSVESSLKVFGKVVSGLIATGDSFISDSKKLNELTIGINNLKAVEMEGASVAQVAEQENIPWLIIRVISDSADDSAEDDFISFLKKYQNHSSLLIEFLLEKISILISK